MARSSSATRSAGTPASVRISTLSWPTPIERAGRRPPDVPQSPYRQEVTERHAELKQIYTRYKLAVDRLESAIREFSEARRLAISEHGISAPRDTESEQTFEPAQREYDEACEILKLLAPVKTREVALQQRELYNGFVREALDGKYDFDASYESIVEAAQPVLAAMRLDLGTPDKSDNMSMSRRADP